ncbi:hypothetical protein EI555_012962 [Monodon monoceros]|uniref:Uncharacterized protein n=1 Tax=Monodon monoceros TaxID=40151 RepID=A0A4V5P9M7_MONMO|nr:hypothetical protein EI555_012962 [Monodon monoceros]
MSSGLPWLLEKMDPTGKVPSLQQLVPCAHAGATPRPRAGLSPKLWQEKPNPAAARSQVPASAPARRPPGASPTPSSAPAQRLAPRGSGTAASVGARARGCRRHICYGRLPLGTKKRTYEQIPMGEKLASHTGSIVELQAGVSVDTSWLAPGQLKVFPFAWKPEGSVVEMRTKCTHTPTPGLDQDEAPVAMPAA